jgi:hypothetical protein
MASHHLDDAALTKLRQAAEEARWLLDRGYPEAAVNLFVGEHRALDGEQQRLLAVSARLGAALKHHIARELDPEDVSRRPLRVDTASLLSVVATGLRGHLLVESGAGVLADPSWSRDTLAWDEAFDGALDRCCGALKGLRPKTCSWLVDPANPEAPRLEAGLVAASKKHKLKATVKGVEDVVTELQGAPFVVSCDPAILDHCATWMNLAPLALAGAVANHPLRLDE